MVYDLSLMFRVVLGSVYLGRQAIPISRRASTESPVALPSRDLEVSDNQG